MDPNTTFFFSTSLLIALIIFISIFRLYQKTKFVDYLILLGLISAQFITGILNPVTLDDKSTRLLQIRESILIWGFYLFFLHGIRLIKRPATREYRGFNIGMILYILILQILILFWDDMMQESVKNFGINFKPEPNYAGEGAGIRVLNHIIYSSGHTFLRDILTTFVSIIILYGYFTVNPPNPTIRIQRAHKIWKIVSVSFVIVSILDSWIWRISNISPDLAVYFLVIGASGLLIVSIWYPEAVLISHSQIYRISNLYSLIDKLSESSKISNRTKELLDYLESLPSVLEK